MEEKLYYLAFSHFLGIGPVKLNSLLSRLKTIKQAYQASDQLLTEILGNKLAEKFIQFRLRFNPQKKLEELTAKKITVVCWSDSSYPPAVKKIPDPPICLYFRGSVDNFNWKKDLLFAVVGTRMPSTYGEQVANKFSRELAKLGLVIVSGMAVGVDTIAHQACLAVGGRTVAVLGCGVDIIYPASNAYLYWKIIKQGGLVISEFPPGQYVEKGLFVARNRIISGLSRGVMIVEGAKDSGAMITARYAAEQGRDVFAPPAPITSVMSQAPNILLKEGEKLVTDVGDILDELNLKIVPKKKEEIVNKLSSEEKKIFASLNNRPQTADELAISLNHSINQILNLLSMLEIKGVVEKNSAGRYQLMIY